MRIDGVFPQTEIGGDPGAARAYVLGAETTVPKGWRGRGASHLSLDTMDRGPGSVGHHIDAPVRTATTIHKA